MLTVIPITYFGGMVRKPFLKIWTFFLYLAIYVRN
jgi:hypothetical protein